MDIIGTATAALGQPTCYTLCKKSYILPKPVIFAIKSENVIESLNFLWKDEVDFVGD